MKWLDDLVGFAHDQLDDRVLEELWGRGVSEDQIKAYSLGHLDNYLPEADYPPAFMEWWEKQPRDDVFVFPLTNTLGQVRGIQLRHVDSARKGYTDYVSTKEEPVYFGLSQAMAGIWEHEMVILVEGTFDLFPIQRHMPFTVSTLHAGLPTPLWRVFRRLVRKIILAYDMDSGGRDATYQIIRKYRDHVGVQALKFPAIPYPKKNRPIKDPGELWEVWGDEPFGVFLRKHLDPYHMEI